jgi:hypothetical protein
MHASIWPLYLIVVRSERIYLWKVANRELVGTDKDAVFRWTGEETFAVVPASQCCITSMM